MALKLKLTKEAYDALPDVLKAEYKADGDGYKLDADYEDVGELRRAHERTKQEAKEAKEKADEAQRKLDEINGNNARKSGDIETLEKSWKEKLNTEVGTRESRIKLLEGGAISSAVDAATARITSSLTDHGAILNPHIRSRITAEIGEDGNAVVRILDKDGKVSAMTADDLQKEFAGNKDFSSIIRASKASGGGAGGAGSGGMRGGAGQFSHQQQGEDLARQTPAQVAAAVKAKIESRNQ